MKKLMYKTLASFLTIIFFAVSLMAQDAGIQEAEVQRVVEKFTTLYELNAEQVVTMTEIETRRLRNLQEIAAMQNSNPEEFRAKRRAIHKGTDVSIRRMLTSEQRKLYYKEQFALREVRAKKAEEMTEAGASMTEIEDALLDIEDTKY